MPSSLRKDFSPELELRTTSQPIAGHLRLVDEDGADRAFARGFFVLVDPAAVVGERLAGEKFRIVRGRLVDQHEQDFAFDVDAFVVVPVVFGRLDAVADVDDLGVDVRFAAAASDRRRRNRRAALRSMAVPLAGTSVKRVSAPGVMPTIGTFCR